MSATYLLPCSCGQKLTIEISQAGQQLQCECGESVEVPSLRGIRQLEASTEPAKLATPARDDWSQTQGILFGGGLALAITALLLGGLIYVVYSQLSLNMTLEKEIAGDRAIIDALTAEQSLDTWTEFRTIGLGERTPPEYILEQRRGSLLMVIMIVCGVAAGLGLVSAIGSFFFRAKA